MATGLGALVPVQPAPYRTTQQPALSAWRPAER